VVEQAQRLLAPANAADAAPLVQGAGEDLRTLALVSLGAAELWFLRTEEAERHLEQAVALARRIGRPFLEAGALAHSAWAAGSRSFALAVERSTHATELARWTAPPPWRTAAGRPTSVPASGYAGWTSDRPARISPCHRLSWLPGQATGFHDHGGSAGAFAVVWGTLLPARAWRLSGTG
jgi:hypothetical protein